MFLIKRNFTSKFKYDVVQFDRRFNSYDAVQIGLTLEQAQAVVESEASLDEAYYKKVTQQQK